MLNDKENQLIYESYINEGIHLKGDEWEEAFDKWQDQLDQWRSTGMLDDIDLANKHLFPIIMKESKLTIFGDDTIVYFAPVQQVDVGSGKKNDRAGVVGIEQAIDKSIIQAYKINATGMDLIRNWWAPYHPATKINK